MILLCTSSLWRSPGSRCSVRAATLPGGLDVMIPLCNFGIAVQLRLADWLVGRGWADWLVSWRVVWLAGWLIGWLAGWLVGWLVGSRFLAAALT